ncbi:metalloregulator ArsR/SmtB family transcription factor [soil metagenome]
MQTPDPLDAKFAALADPTRRAILARLTEGEASVNDLAAPFDMSLPAVSKHLKVLEKAGLISRGKEAQWRPARLEPMGMKGIAEWLEHYRRYWDQSFDRLDDYLRKIQKGNDDGKRN